ncbi:dNA replication and repair protein RecN [Clostridium sp. CAG:567]|jgi:DNA repair protein RecN|nr:dNA replication and repair protein RecN [Clostridium sp. CAG:567]
MVTTLHIKNVGIIDDLSIDLNNGFNVLTGETGAGKTLIIGSLAILAGGRFSKEMIRNGEEFSYVEANFYCPNNEVAVDGNIIVSREIHLNGRNSCKINGRLITVNELKEFMSKIIDIHGQHDSQLILNPMQHIIYLDKFIGKELNESVCEYIKKLEEYNKLKQELKNTYGEDQEKERRLDLLRYQYNEIEQAKLKQNEEEELQNKHKMMQNAEKLKDNLFEIDTNLNENAIIAISNSIRSLEKIQDCGKEYSEKLSILKNSYYDIQELARDLSYMREEVDFDENERNQIENRLDLIFSLKRKYGNTITEILEFRNKIENEINKIENLDEYHNKIKIQIKNLEQELFKIANQMSNVRTKYAETLSKKINQELKDLEMPNAKFEIKINKTERFCENGIDEVEFMICTNVGEGLKPLTKIASGGEMARIMLAIKNVLADVDEVSTLVFDEIDTGISGKASKAVAEKMKSIAELHQVICITHLPSIAARGDYNYYISKQTKENKTYTSIKLLNEDETIEEIARISSGEVTEIAKAHAKELRKAS